MGGIVYGIGIVLGILWVGGGLVWLIWGTCKFLFSPPETEEDKKLRAELAKADEAYGILEEWDREKNETTWGKIWPWLIWAAIIAFAFLLSIYCL